MNPNNAFTPESLRLVGAALALQQASGTAAQLVPLPGTDRVVVIGTAAEVAQLLVGQHAAPVAQADDARDAARYRWLRDPDTDVALVLDKRTGFVPPVDDVPGVGGYHTYEYRAGEELDTAIDAAMSAQQGQVQAQRKSAGGAPAGADLADSEGGHHD